MKHLAAVATMMLATTVQAKTITVAVVDTGFDMKSKWENINKVSGLARPKICKSGHWSGISNDSDVTDNHGHGTHIAGIIAKGNEMVDYCMVILKYYDPKVPGANNQKNTLESFKRAINYKVDIINYSGGGTDMSKEECALLKSALDKGIEVVAAAGNERSNLDIHPYYPALCDPRIRVVENRDAQGEIPGSSNYSKEKYNTYAALGVNVMSILPGNSYGYMTGTSQSTAVITSKIIGQIAANRLKNPENISYKHCSKSFTAQMLCEVEYKRDADTCKYVPSVDLRKYESRKRKEVKR